MKGNWRILGLAFGHLLFWGWNLLFVLVVGLGLGPTVLLSLGVAVATGMVPWPFAAFGAALLALPVLGMALGAWKLRTDPGRLLSLFYGVQAPLMVLCAVRLFAISALTPASALFLAVVALGCLGLLRTLLHGFAEPTALGQAGRQVAQTAYLAFGAWAVLWVGLYALPIALIVVEGLVRLPLRADWSFVLRDPGQLLILPTLAVWTLFFAFTAGMLLVWPFAAFGISARAFQVVSRATLSRLGAGVTAGLTLGTLAALGLAFGVATRQPQAEAFALLEAATSDAARREALTRSDRIRAGLLEARLSAVRYLDGDPEGAHVDDLWEEGLGTSLWGAPSFVWRLAARPFLYRPVHEGRVGGRFSSEPADRAEAEQAYAAFFDAPMARAEREVLVAASRNTWSVEEAQATLLEIGERRVHLDRQEVVVEPHGDVARVLVHDVYRNRSWERQEVSLSFSLPEGAAATGLWLGHADDRDQAFAFVVATRGAAQEVYESEVRRRVDPALLEQVGPRQYRLRAFPIEPREGRPDDPFSIRAEGPELHLWLELAVPVVDDADGTPVFPLPVTSEVRNLFWDADTVRTLDGAEVRADDWLPAPVRAEGAMPRAHVVTLGDHEVRAEPAGAVTPVTAGRIAVWIDETRSMEARRDEVAHALRRLRGAAREVEVWCAREQRPVRCDDFDPSTALFWGAVALETRLAALAPSVAGAEALVVLTDGGSYELAAAAEAAGLPDVTLPPLWLVHLGGFPSAYPDWTADRLQRSGGGVVGSVEALQVAWADPAVVDGWRWSFGPATGAPSEPGPIRAIAARRLVAHLDRQARAHGLDTLDALHAVAKEAAVVTPYSSMIVLVEDRQRGLLAEAEARADRFDREVTGDPAPAEVSAVPEPGTWLLLGLGGAALLGARRRRAPLG